MLAGLSFGGALLVPMLQLADWSDVYMLSGMDANLLFCDPPPNTFSPNVELIRFIKTGPQRRIISAMH